MDPTTHLHDTGPTSDGAVVFVLDGHGVVLQCTTPVLDLTGHSVTELRGRSMTDLGTEPASWHEPFGMAPGGSSEIRTALRHRDGSTVDVDAEVLALPAGSAARFLVCAVPSALGRRRTEDQALLRALFNQSRIGLVVHDTDLRMTRVNLDPEYFGLKEPPDTPNKWYGARLEQILVAEDAEAIEERLRRVLESGEPLIDWESSARRLIAPQEDRLVSLSAFRLQDTRERVIGVAVVLTEVTEQRTTRRRMALLHAAAARLGQTLDIVHNAEELTRILVPDFADLACVDLVDAILHGQEPGTYSQDTPMCRVAVASADGAWPPEVHQRQERLHPQGAENDAIRGGRPVLATDLTALRRQGPTTPEWRRLVLPDTATSLLAVPLRARGHVLGALALWRTGNRTPFTEDDVPLVEEIASRAALSVENARRYTSELRTVESLQRSLLPPAGVELSAAETAGTYVPAGTAAGVGGCWYDVIPLSSSRVAFVIGDVAGHGLGATATMGRLRTAVQTLADLDLAPEELLTHLDDLVVRLSATESQSNGGENSVVGATCLYCVYDPVTGRCAMASAGHPPPVLTGTGGGARCVDLRPGPALGLGGMPFDPLELHLGPGHVLAFYTNELIDHGAEGHSGARLERLNESLESAVAAGRPPTEIGHAVLDHVLTEPPTGDVALLVAKVRALSDDATASWRFTADPTVVAQARDLVTDQLTAWGLEELTFTTELIVSELITNAIRYAGPPIGLRLIRDKTLICEVSDPSQTQPHLRRARLTDEGGRGLFLIAQVTHRWGSRYTSSGKTIWTEQSLTSSL
ncbi:ATP-binding SpoIIE family protein phosphatase [Streptomyces megasporus]|uniref:ATP-binding SpoIIE family protein phosphatase n=1 Tax=Streptomyces megasporus TaxID=44060 RepID=UPI0004E1A131|nr:SpoIIE family protein phosphatase [Streptomyces megasporus]